MVTLLFIQLEKRELGLTSKLMQVKCTKQISK